MKYRYFLLGDTVPIRVGYNENDHAFSAEVPDREKRELAMKVTYLSRVEQSMEVDKIDRQGFERHCKRFWDDRGLPE